jgi:hypothetical protein
VREENRQWGSKAVNYEGEASRDEWQLRGEEQHGR